MQMYLHTLIRVTPNSNNTILMQKHANVSTYTYQGHPKFLHHKYEDKNQDYQNIKTFHIQFCIDSGQMFKDRNFPYLIRTANMHMNEQKYENSKSTL